MGNSAIVVGVDGYSNSDWVLDGAVRDALAFAAWAVQGGRVGVADLHLLLTPGNEVQLANPVTIPGTKLSVAYELAESGQIMDAIDQMGKADEGKGFIYYAGHGCSAPNSKEELFPEPVLIPSDVAALTPKFMNRVLSYSNLIYALLNNGPPEQFFFFDACRDFSLEGYRRGVGSVMGAIRSGGSRRNQYLLHASSPGQKAEELRGVGVFGELLVEALTGNCALEFNDVDDTFDLTFSSLTKYVRESVSRRIRCAFPKGAAEYVQDPQAVPSINKTDTVIASYKRGQVPKCAVKVRVNPSGARAKSNVNVYYYTVAGEQVLREACVPGPFEIPVTVNVLPGNYSFRVETSAAEVLGKQSVSVPKMKEVGFEIDQAFVASASRATVQGVTEVPAPSVAAPAPEAPNYLVFSCLDKTLPIVIYRPGTATPSTGIGEFSIHNAQPGLYRAMLVLPEGLGPEVVFEFPFDGALCELSPPLPKMNRPQMDALAAVGMLAEAPFITPSEMIGNTGDAGLASLLAYAAYATNSYRRPEYMNKLRRLGVKPIPSVSSGNGWVTVLLAASGDAPVVVTPLSSRPPMTLTPREFLSGSVVSVLTYTEDVQGRGVPVPLSGFPAAAEFGCECAPGSKFIELRLPGTWHTRYATVVQPERATVLVIVANDDGSFDVQHYLFPFDAEPAGLPPQDLRLLEKAQRFYTSANSLPEHILEGIRKARVPDPVGACLAGYILLRQNRSDEFTTPLATDGSAADHVSLKQKLLQYYPDLPDTHILTALTEPDRQSVAKHFSEAANRGLPLFMEGVRAWYQAAGATLPAFYRGIAHSLIPGSPWTAWTAHEPVLDITAGKFGTIPHQWQALEPKRLEIIKLLPSVGAVQKVSSDSNVETIATAFLISPTRAITSYRVAAETAEEVAGQWRFRQDCQVYLDFGEDPPASEGLRMRVTEIKIVPDGRLSLITLATAAPAPPLLIPDSAAAASVLDNVFLIGYPTSDARNDTALATSVIGEMTGRKMLQPGIVLEVDGSRKSLDHSCFTMRGSGGSPLIHLDTGKVVAVHWGGWKRSYGRGRAMILHSGMEWLRW